MPWHRRLARGDAVGCDARPALNGGSTLGRPTSAASRRIWAKAICTRATCGLPYPGKADRSPRLCIPFRPRPALACLQFRRVLFDVDPATAMTIPARHRPGGAPGLMQSRHQSRTGACGCAPVCACRCLVEAGALQRIAAPLVAAPLSMTLFFRLKSPSPSTPKSTGARRCRWR